MVLFSVRLSSTKPDSELVPVIARNEVTKQSFTTLFENCFTRTDCFAPIKNRGSQWRLISGFSHCEGWND